MSKLNEKKIIELFQKKLGNTNFVSEDVEYFKNGYIESSIWINQYSAEWSGE